MKIYTTKPIKELINSDLKDLLINRELIVSPHALDHERFLNKRS